MTENVTFCRSKVSTLDAVQRMRKRNELSLLTRFFRGFEKHIQRRQRLVHLKRCAFLLKHQGMRRIVTYCFMRWLSTTQRKTSIRAGRRELTKIVVFPKNQDFINLGVRCLRRWGVWVRKLRQRKRTNVELFQSKLNEGRMHRALHHWMCVTHERQQSKIWNNVDELDKCNSILNGCVADLQTQLDQKEKEIRDLKLCIEDMKARGAVQSVEVEDLRRTLEVSIRSLLYTRSSKDTLNAHQTKQFAEELARRGDGIPLQLLTDCEAVAHATSRLQKLLPDKKVHATEEFSAVVDAVCDHVEELDIQIREGSTGQRSARALAAFLLKFVHDGAERVSHFVDYDGFSKPPSVQGTKNEESLARPLSDCTSYIEYLLEKCGSDDEAEIVRAHLSSSQTISGEAQPTAFVLRYFYDTLLHLRKGLLQRDELFAEQRKHVGEEIARRGVLSSAAFNAVKVLRGWKNIPDISTSMLSGVDSGSIDEDEDGGSVAEEKLITQLLHESRSAAQTLAGLREALIGSAPNSVPDASTSKSDAGTNNKEDTRSADTLNLIALPAVESHTDLPAAARKLRERLEEIGEAYKEICTTIFQCDGSDRNGGRRASSVVETVQGRVAHARHVMQEVRKNISGRIYEVKTLRRAMRSGIAELGGVGDESESDDNAADTDFSAKKSLAISEELMTLCRDTGTAIDDTNTALGIYKGTRMRLSDIISILKQRMDELETMREESAALAKDIWRDFSDESSNGSPLTVRRSLKPKPKPNAYLHLMHDSCLLVAETPQRTPPSLVLTQHESPIPTGGNPIQRLRSEVKEKVADARRLHTACATLLAFLDGSLSDGNYTNSARRYSGRSLVPFIIVQVEEVKRAQRSVDLLFPELPARSRSVGGCIALLAESVESLRLSVADLRAECDLRARQSMHLLADCNAECQRLSARGARRMACAVDALRRGAGRAHAQRRFAEWRAQAGAAAAAAQLDAALAELRLSGDAPGESAESASHSAHSAVAAVAARAAAVAVAAEDIAAERAVMRRRAADREAMERELQRVTAELDTACAVVEAQDARLAQMQREHRDAGLSAAMCGAVIRAPREDRRESAAAESAMIAEAKRLAREAMDAMTWSDVAVDICAFAEMTLELYGRMADTLEALCSNAGVGAEWIAEVRSLSSARDNIATRLPDILSGATLRSRIDYAKRDY